MLCAGCFKEPAELPQIRERFKLRDERVKRICPRGRERICGGGKEAGVDFCGCERQDVRLMRGKAAAVLQLNADTGALELRKGGGHLRILPQMAAAHQLQNRLVDGRGPVDAVAGAADECAGDAELDAHDALH